MAAPPTNNGNGEQDNMPMLLVPAGNTGTAVSPVKNGFHTKTWGDGSKYLPDPTQALFAFGRCQGPYRLALQMVCLVRAPRLQIHDTCCSQVPRGVGRRQNDRPWLHDLG